jgi:hypothetical protein
VPRNSRTNRPALGEPLAPLALELRHLAADGSARQPARLVEEAHLHGRVAVAIGRAHREDRAWAGFDHGDRHDRAVGVEHLRHPDLAAEKALAPGCVGRGSGGRFSHVHFAGDADQPAGHPPAVDRVAITLEAVGCGSIRGRGFPPHGRTAPNLTHNAFQACLVVRS